MSVGFFGGGYFVLFLLYMPIVKIKWDDVCESYKVPGKC